MCSWSEGIEGDDAYLSGKERLENNEAMRHDVIKSAEQAIIDRETIAKIDFTRVDFGDDANVDFIVTLARRREWAPVDTIMESLDKRTARNLLTSGAVAKAARQELESLERYTELIVKHIESAAILYWLLSDKFFRTASDGDISRFIDLVIRLWQHRMNACGNRFF